jgi:ABC-type proline/glycine betaine transport system substrate-binding protein
MIAIHPSLLSSAPDLPDFFWKWDFDAESQIDTLVWRAENEASIEEAAIWFLDNKGDVWTPKCSQ